MEAVRDLDFHPFPTYQTYLLGGKVNVGNFPSALTTTHTAIDETVAGDRTIITPSSGKTLRIAYLQLQAKGGDQTLIVKENATARIPEFDVQGGAGFTFNGFAPIKFTTADAPFILNLSAATRVTGFVITYEE